MIPQLHSIDAPDLEPEDQHLLNVLIQQWQYKIDRNVLRTSYYDGRNRLKDLGIAIPPQLQSIETVVGWPAKAVDSLANRIRFDGFVASGVEQDPLGLQSILDANNFAVEFAGATRSTLTHSCSFVSLSSGDTSIGEPEVMVRFRSAIFATGLWDVKSRSLTAALTITELDPQSLGIGGQLVPTEVQLFTPLKAVVITKAPNGVWHSVEQYHNLGHTPVYMLTYHPDLDRPFGRSRINRAVMSLTDTAVRTMLRTEVSAEFFTSPQRYVLGANDEAFTDASGAPIPGWKAVIGRMLALGADENGVIPSVGQFPQMTMQPHTEMFRSLAARFSGETGVPMSSLGVMTDSGPSSADAIYAAQEDLVVEAENTIDVFSPVLKNVARDIIALRDGPDAVTQDAFTGLQANFRRPDRPSVSAMSDAMLKQIQAVPWLADTDVVLEQLGYTEGQVSRLLSDKKRGQAASILAQLTSAQKPVQGGQG